VSGKFITFEGIDGAGKSTHLAWAADWLRARGHRVRLTREPGGTALGEKLRAILLDPRSRIHPETEAILMFAARKEHLDSVIRPALAKGETVLCDRFTDASFAYQGGGRGVATGRLLALEEWVQQGLQPDLTVVFDLPLEAAKTRLASSKKPDRFEREGSDFFERVRRAYLARAREAPSRIHVVDSSGTVAGTQKALEEVLLRVCPT
jgi:dTMP kinase